MIKNKRGQYYLVAALIIITIIIGFVTLSNYSEKISTETTVYGLEKGLEVESAKVLDYGVYNGLDEVNMAQLLEGFSQAYSEYAELDKLYFIFGNSQNVSVAGYHDLEDGEVLVNLGGKESSKIKIDKQIYKKQDYTAEEEGIDKIDIVTITINGVEYRFELYPGENFYFILTVNLKGEQYVITNQEE
ncbi:MAG: hypothetical protein V1788_00325 [Nanoarchaeota archaeon]|nr:hypothetical protein [Nanoarchaeota archaeon]